MKNSRDDQYSFYAENAPKILQLLQEEAAVQFPIFPEAFGIFHTRAYALKDSPIGTDGTYLYYNPETLCQVFLTEPDKLHWMYLHTILHIILNHCEEAYSEFSPQDQNADFQTSRIGYLLTKNNALDRCLSFFVPDKIIRYFESPKDPLTCSKDYFYCDSHELWYNKERINPQVPSEQKVSSDALNKHIRKNNSILLKEKIRQKIIDAALENDTVNTGKRGHSRGTGTEDAELQKRNSLDYHQFLERFMIPREEAILDIDSFDYIPYHYGLAYYENLPFIEPLEYKEVNRLDELAIAIDTSGSCSGVVVRRFLEETWNILSQRENFFNKMRIHLIQCDCMVQEHRIFTSVEEWEEAVPTLQIHGHGDTDFQPVFTYLEKMIKKGEIRQLRGLLFFTDGDGIFPPVPPSFDTAFVFLNNETEKHAIPDWGIRLNLNLPDVF